MITIRAARQHAGRRRIDRGLLAIAVGLGFKFGLIDAAGMQPAVIL